MSTPTLNKAVIGVGANTTDGARRVKSAIKHLRDILTDYAASEIYFTPAVGRQDAPAYCNAVVEGLTPLDATELNARLKDYESACGRQKGGEVVIDLDLVIFNDEILRRRDFEADYFSIGYQHLLNHNGL